MTPARRTRRPVPAALLAAVLAAGILPGSGLAGAGTSAPTTAASAAPQSASSTAPAGAAVISATDAELSAADAPIGATGSAAPAGRQVDEQADTRTAGAADAGAGAGVGAPGAATVAPTGSGPSEAYEAWLAHEHDHIAFTPGGRVTVGFTPRASDGWTVGGAAPAALPAGQASGAAIAASRTGEVTADPGVGSTTGSAPALAAAPGAVAAASTGAGLRRQVFGFLPYWELSGASTRLNYSVLTTIAYFSVGADAAGNLRRRNSDGSLTTGWGGWTSSSMTAVINAAHAHGTRVVLTASVFAWSGGGAATQRALLGSATARANLARQLAAAVRDRGADGVNLDFEPLVAGQESNFVALLTTLRSKLNAIRSGYQITYDTTGYIGNYPLEASVGPSAADAVFIMGYDYRTASSSSAGSIDPLSGPGYDLADTVREYTARISPSRVILGIPWYGRAWSTSSSSPRAANISGAKYGYSAAVNYENIPALVAAHGRHWDSVEQSPYIVYRRKNCTSTYGCVTSWRQVWYEDAASLARRYQTVSDYGLRGAGMWALGYDGAYQDMVRALSDAFLVDHAAPDAGIRMLPAKNPDEGIVVDWLAADNSAVRSYDVQASVDGGAWTAWLSATRETSDVWPGADGHAYAFRVRATDARGNVGAWNVTTTRASAPASLAVGGFGRVTLDGLTYRTGPDTSDAKLGSLAAGTVVALTSGPVSADGYTWYEVTQPVREWAPVSFVERGVWIAVRSSSASFVAPFHAPNATVVDAGITGLDFGGGGLVGSAAADVAGRTFSPNGDGSRDGLRVRWTATTPLDGLMLNVLRLDGSLVGAVGVPALTAGTHTYTWDGTVGGRRVADGRYLLQLVGTAGAKTFHAPSAMPATAGQIAGYAVTVDTVAPVIRSSSATSGLISPNGDGLRERIAFTLTSAGATSWVVRIAAGTADPLRTAAGSGGTIAFTWNGRADGGAVVPDGRYTATLAVCDVAGNCATRAYPMRVDTTAPTVTPAARPPLFSPNGDGTLDRVTLGWAASETVSGTASVWRGTTLVRRWTVGVGTAGSVTWDGRNTAGSGVADGRYTFRVDVRDNAGNRRVAATSVTLDRTAGWLRWSRPFCPQDGDALAPTSTLTWRLTRTATTTLAVYDTAGTLVRAVWSGKSQAAGTRTWTWDGRAADKTLVPQGAYTARLSVVTPYGTAVLTRTVWASAFPAALSATTVRPGQILTVTFSSAEALKSTPRVTFRQPGHAAVTISATRLADGSYRARFAVRAGAAGAGSVRIAATDAGGHANATTYAVTVAA